MILATKMRPFATDYKVLSQVTFVLVHYDLFLLKLRHSNTQSQKHKQLC